MAERTDAISGRLLYLEPEQTLSVPYNDEPPLECVITRDNQIEREGAWKLDGYEMAFINHLRLARGQPLLYEEVFPYLSGSGNRNKVDALSDVLNGRVGREGLNRGVFGQKAVVTDGSRPRLVRLARALQFIDERERIEQDDRSLLTRFARFTTAVPLPDDLPMRQGKPQPERIRNQHYQVLCNAGALALRTAAVSQRYMYALSLRYGPLEFLRGTLLPLADGRRIAYDDLFPSLPGVDAAEGTIASTAYIVSLLEFPPSAVTGVASKAMKKLFTVAALHQFAPEGCLRGTGESQLLSDRLT